MVNVDFVLKGSEYSMQAIASWPEAPETPRVGDFIWLLVGRDEPAVGYRVVDRTWYGSHLVKCIVDCVEA